jgi:hypothetical protein
MRTSDWNDPRLREIGTKFAADAYEIASELHSYGADASVLLLRKRDWQPRRPHQVCIPTACADALMALLLSLPRSDLGRPRNWAPQLLEASLDRGMSHRAAAKKEAERTGKSAESIARSARRRRANNIGKPTKKK